MATQVTLNSGSVDSAGSLALKTNGTTTAVTIDTSQNVGIGTASPSANLQVNTASGEASMKITSVDTAGVQQSLYFGATGFNRAAIKSLNANTYDGNLQFFTGNASNFAERMRITSAGDVGIGTSSPSARLSVSDAANPKINLLVGGTERAFISYTTATTIASFDSDGDITLSPNNTEAVRVNAAGNLLAGTTSSNGKLTVYSASTNAGDFYVSGTSLLSTPAAFFEKADNNTTTSNIFVKFTINSQATGSGQINANGASAAAFGSFSDSRLKENIVDLPSQLDNIMALRTVEFDYIESEGGGHQIGFIAQEVQEIYPDLVGEREDGMLTLTDLNKNDARLIKAIQEMKAIIDTQASTITQLQADVAALKGTA